MPEPIVVALVLIGLAMISYGAWLRARVIEARHNREREAEMEDWANG